MQWLSFRSSALSIVLALRGSITSLNADDQPQSETRNARNMVQGRRIRLWSESLQGGSSLQLLESIAILKPTLLELLTACAGV